MENRSLNQQVFLPPVCPRFAYQCSRQSETQFCRLELGPSSFCCPSWLCRPKRLWSLFSLLHRPIYTLRPLNDGYSLLFLCSPKQGLGVGFQGFRHTRYDKTSSTLSVGTRYAIPQVCSCFLLKSICKYSTCRTPFSGNKVTTLPGFP